MAKYESHKVNGTDYDQAVADNSSKTTQNTGASNKVQDGSNTRTRESGSSNNVVKKENSGKSGNSYTSVSSSSSERANRAFNITFSIPIKGILPSPPLGTSNCHTS